MNVLELVQEQNGGKRVITHNEGNNRGSIVSKVFIVGAGLSLFAHKIANGRFEVED